MTKLQIEYGKLAIIETQVFLINQCCELGDSMTNKDKTIDELNSIRSEIERKRALIELLEQEKKGV